MDYEVIGQVCDSTIFRLSYGLLKMNTRRMESKIEEYIQCSRTWNLELKNREIQDFYFMWKKIKHFLSKFLNVVLVYLILIILKYNYFSKI